MEDDPSNEKLGNDVYISSLKPETRRLLDDIKNTLLEIEEPTVSDATYAEVSFRLGVLMATHPELGRVPPNVLLRYCGLNPTGLAEAGWIKKQEDDE